MTSNTHMRAERRSAEKAGGNRNPPLSAHRLTQRCAGAACGIALLALAGWLADARFLAGQWGGAIPMAPSTALAFLILSGGVFAHARWPAHRWSRYFAPVSSGLPALLGLLVLAQFIAGFDSGVERAMARTNELFGQIPLGRMSPLTAASFLLESAALMLLLRATQWRLGASTVVLLALPASAINVVVLVGYLDGAPLLYGGTTIPMALPTALAFVLVAVGQIGLVLQRVPALRAWSGNSMRGVLLRAFLPAMLLVLLLEGLMDNWQPAVGSVNLALWNSLTALLAAALIVARTGWTARRTGDAIERAEEELHESRALLQAVISGTSDAIFAKDQQSRYLLFNRAAERFTGKTAASVLGQSDAFLFPPAEAAVVMEEDRKVIETGTTVTYEEEVTTSGGRLTTFLSTKGPLWDASGRCQGLFGIARDITDRKRAEAEKAKLEAQLQQAQKMESIGRLAGGVAHDFNNLLTVINGYSQLLLAQLSAGDPLRAGLVEISKAGDRAAGLTRQLLAFSRKQVLEPRVLDLNQVVEEMRSMLGRVVGEDVEVRVALHAEAGMVHADPHQLEQVLMNVVVNARDAMPGGGKLLIETARVGRYVMLAVSDNGMGMDEQTRRQIFEPFFTTKGAGQGTGLGLSMVQGIVAQSGGYIDVYSEPCHGTTFKIYLPAPVETAADAGKPAAVAALGGDETVLVVEDQAQVRAYAVAVLKNYGYRVIEAEGAGDALLLCERDEGRIDLVLTDVVMPHVSGPELARRLEKLQPGIQVLFMSGYTDDAIVHNGVLEEGAEFIQKPFSPEQLAGKVRAVLGSQ